MEPQTNYNELIIRNDIIMRLYQKYNLEPDYYIHNNKIFKRVKNPDCLHEWMNEKFIKDATELDRIILTIIKNIKEGG